MSARTTRVLDSFWQPTPLLAEPDLRAWLLDRGSLTARIRARCPSFNVRLLRQGPMRISRDEAQLLGLRRTELAIGRDVLLCCGTTPVVYAHSALRASDLRGPWQAVSNMGTRPLGAALFADSRIARGALAFRRLPRGHPLYCAAAKAVGKALPPLWARRSLFWSQGAPLLVTEAFLPAVAGLPKMET